MRAPSRVTGVLVCAALVGLMAWRYVVASESSVSPAGSAGAASASAHPAPLDSRRAQTGSLVASAPEAREIKARLLVAQLRQRLGAAYERTAARGDFALTPSRLLKSLLDRRCGALRSHLEELTPYRAQLQLEGPDGAAACRSLLFGWLKERFALPDDLTQERLWSMLEQVDSEYERLVVSQFPFASDEALLAAHERFREARRGILGPSIEGPLFGLSDELFQLPYRVDHLATDSHTSVDQKLAAWQEWLQRLESEHGVRLASVVEPVELAKLELRIRETAGPLGPEQQRAVYERHAGSESALRYLEHQREQTERRERLDAFNLERARLLEQLTRSGLTPEQLRQRMPAVDQQLLVKHQLQ
ncbi:lipase secretion chaperone [Pyxidicoccus caerfyrddinensis]|uniref:lipase secretion chaperone n=1 Tax=Pyxidicoccus caerfyrddinensis TaxID=2709663 RepID=UPI0013DCDD38|nr:lipase secretion chaperone [Pyxidicoccus caerfyrddinensis]